MHRYFKWKNMTHISLNARLILIAIITFSTVKFTKTDTDTEIDAEIDINDKLMLDNLKNISFTQYISQSLIPLHYDVKIEFDLYKNVFFGECNITIQINRRKRIITILNSEIFAIIKIDLIIKDNDNQTINIPKFSFTDKAYIQLDFTHSSEFLTRGIYILKMIYVRTMLNSKDLFRSLYIDEEENKVSNSKSFKMLTARELFPCWDQPEFQSTFNISIRYHKKYKFLSNMPIHNIVKDVNDTTWIYKLPLMSAQDLIIVITTFIHTSVSAVSCWYRNEIKDQMRFAEQIIQEIVYYLKQKSTKEISKIDYLVIKDFQHIDSNLNTKGFILLREEDIIYNDILDDFNRQIEVANLIAYQTISYWYADDILWSKESFIIFLAAYILNQTQLLNYSTNRMIDLFVVQTQQEFLRFDLLPNTDSLLLQHIANTFTVNSFKSYNYIKSSIMWRRIYHLMSDDLFWTSLNSYTEHNQSKTDNNLWNVMNTVLNNNTLNKRRQINPEHIINFWIMEKQTDCSEILVEIYDEDIEIKYVESNTNATCPALVTYMTKKFYYRYSWINRQKTMIIVIEEFLENDWILVNLKQTGYYRVNYDDTNWKNLANYLYENHTNIHALNRAQIIDDAFYFLMQKKLNFTMLWNITSFLSKDTDYIAWYPMIKAIEYMTCIFPMIQGDHVMSKITVMFNALLQNIGYNSLHDNDYIKYLREEAVKWACVLGVSECREAAASKLEIDLYGLVKTKRLTLKEWIYCKGLMIANNSIWLGVYDNWKETNDNTLLEYLICSKNSSIISNYLMILMKNEFRVKDNMRAYIILLTVERHAKDDTVFEFILEHLKSIEFSTKKLVDQIAILIVIITQEYSIERFGKIRQFVKINLREKSLVINAVEQKIKKRKLECQKKVTNYGRVGTYQMRTRRRKTNH